MKPEPEDVLEVNPNAEERADVKANRGDTELSTEIPLPSPTVGPGVSSPDVAAAEAGGGIDEAGNQQSAESWGRPFDSPKGVDVAGIGDGGRCEVEVVLAEMVREMRKAVEGVVNWKLTRAGGRSAAIGSPAAMEAGGVGELVEILGGGPPAAFPISAPAAGTLNVMLVEKRACTNLRPTENSYYVAKRARFTAGSHYLLVRSCREPRTRRCQLYIHKPCDKAYAPQDRPALIPNAVMLRSATR